MLPNKEPESPIGEPKKPNTANLKMLKPDWGRTNEDIEMDEVKRALWCVGGVVMESRNLEDAVLMRVRVSKEMQDWAYNGEPLPAPKRQINQEFYEEAVRLTSGIKEGIFLILRIPKMTWHVFGGVHSGKIGEDSNRIAFQRLNSVRQFFTISDEMEKAIKAMNGQKNPSDDPLESK